MNSNRWTCARAVGLTGALACLAWHQASAAPVQARIDSGVLVGEAQGATVSFKGVPYAAAPVGDRRWAAPAPPPAWATPRRADAFGPVCPQPLNANGAPNAGGAVGPSSEDCLFLNIWSPQSALASRGKAPVMIWLHGGGNTAGAGSLGAYDGEAFAEDGVVLVTLNYRLGALGFFAHPAISRAAGPGDVLINYGIADQIAALGWVKRNIAAFGGDPARVTLFGESAGGQDTLILMTTPAARGLFARAIVESGGGWGPPATLAAREAQGEAIALKAGAPANASLEQLRAIPADTLADDAANGTGPGVDGRLVKETIAQAFADGHFSHVPLIIGSNSFEASLLNLAKIPPATIIGRASDALKAAYANLPDDTARARAMFTDSVMGAPARWIAGQAADGPAWLYYFRYVVDAQRDHTPGAGHASEIPFVFASWDRLGAVGRGIKPTAADLAMTALIHGCWVSFAKTGAPACPGGPAWPAYSNSGDALMTFDGSPSTTAHFRAAQYQAQEAAVLPTLQIAKASVAAAKATAP